MNSYFIVKTLLQAATILQAQSDPASERTHILQKLDTFVVEWKNFINSLLSELVDDSLLGIPAKDKKDKPFFTGGPKSKGYAYPSQLHEFIEKDKETARKALTQSLKILNEIKNDLRTAKIAAHASPEHEVFLETYENLHKKLLDLYKEMSAFVSKNFSESDKQTLYYKMTTLLGVIDDLGKVLYSQIEESAGEEPSLYDLL